MLFHAVTKKFVEGSVFLFFKKSSGKDCPIISDIADILSILQQAELQYVILPAESKVITPSDMFSNIIFFCSADIISGNCEVIVPLISCWFI